MKPRCCKKWLAQWVRGKPPIDGMRTWFNDWWLKHPQNTERTPAFSDMPARLATEPVPPNDAPTYTAPEPTPTPETTPEPTPTPDPTPAPEPTATPEPEVIEKEVITNHLESTVAFVSDGEAAQLTPTAEKCKEALARFLASRETQAPLTVSVEAPWGAGKTSFMSHLRKRLETEMIPTVWFNPWKHEAGKTMWAAFAVAYERQMAARPTMMERWAVRARLAIERLTWTERCLLALRLGAWVVLGVLGAWLLHERLLPAVEKTDLTASELVKSGIKAYAPWLTLLFPLWGLVADLAKNLGSPIKLDMARLFTTSLHEDGVDDLHRFHEDFARLMWAYMPGNLPWSRFMATVRAQTDPQWPGQLRYVFHALVVITCRTVRRWHYKYLLGCPEKLKESLPPRWRQDRIAVFIDDLDRCEAPKAADMLMSLHQMLSVSEQCPSDAKQDQLPPGAICVLGMDREKVAAAVAAKHDKLLPLLLESDATTGKVPKDRAMGFGHEFLEKFIQLTLHLPGMMGEDRLHYLRGITGRRGRQVAQFGEARITSTLRASPTATYPPPSGSASEVVPESIEHQPPAPETPQVVAAAEAAAQRAVEVRVKNVDRQLHDGETAYDCALYVADSLENNPRRLKQFVNLLRLRLLLAAALDLLDVDTLTGDAATVKPGKLSVHHLAKLVALDLTCPQSMAKVRENPGMSLDGLKMLVAAEQAVRASVFTTMLSHGNGPCFDLDAAPLSTYFQQLASVTPSTPSGAGGAVAS
ncbi:MAG: hypothetical protein JNM99_04295 [Verrucomicrobiaceae bacterium]|nr:hypothetical protein [Verrucomicrobiaceae bacterium]